MTDKEMCATFAKNLTDLMSDKSIKQADIVKKLHVSKGTVSGWCSGQNIPRTGMLSNLMQMLDVELSDLLVEKEPTPVSEDGLDDEKRIFIEKLKSMDSETVAALNKLADSIISKRDQ